MELFENDNKPKETSRKPLADRIRPKTLDEVVGQEHLLGKGKILRVLLNKKDVPSLIFWGPSGVGKTTLGWLIGKHMKVPYVSLSAVNIGIKEVKEIIQKAKFQKIVLFIDEFHRFNKLQQDTFLPHAENGDIILIGATTENPSFDTISPLLSRMKVLTLKALTQQDLVTILKRALNEDTELKKASLRLDNETIEELALLANGDARKALNLLEVCFMIVKRTVTANLLSIAMYYRKPIKEISLFMTKKVRCTMISSAHSTRACGVLTLTLPSTGLHV